MNDAARIAELETALRDQSEVATHYRTMAADYGKQLSGLHTELATAKDEVARLENLRAFDTGSKTLPAGLVLEHTRLDGYWQKLVKERDEMKFAITKRICDQNPFDYLLHQFPATQGHIPLREWFENLKSKSLCGTTAADAGSAPINGG